MSLSTEVYENLMIIDIGLTNHQPYLINNGLKELAKLTNQEYHESHNVYEDACNFLAVNYGVFKVISNVCADYDMAICQNNFEKNETYKKVDSNEHL